MRLLLVLTLLASACSAADVAPHPKEAAWREDMRATIRDNGWAKECARFEAMTPQQRGEVATLLVAFDAVEDEAGARRYMAVSAEECNRTKP